MKTTSYNTEKEIKIGILIAVFAISIFTAVRVKELQLNDASNAYQTRSSHVLINKENSPSMPTLNAKLIEEPAPAVGALLKTTEYKATAYVESEMALERESFQGNNNEAAGAELALQIKPSMTASEYKASDYTNTEMALESERFFNSENEAIESELANQVKQSMIASEYKAADYVNAEMASEELFNAEDEAIEPELALQMESWMTATEYKATDYANADMELESEGFLTSENESELALQVQSWMTATEYKATEYANADMALESERFLNSIATTNNQVARAETAEGNSTSAIE